MSSLGTEKLPHQQNTYVQKKQTKIHKNHNYVQRQTKDDYSHQLAEQILKFYLKMITTKVQPNIHN